MKEDNYWDKYIISKIGKNVHIVESSKRELKAVVLSLFISEN
jgi:hypothetical protein